MQEFHMRPPRLRARAINVEAAFFPSVPAFSASGFNPVLDGLERLIAVHDNMLLCGPLKNAEEQVSGHFRSTPVVPDDAGRGQPV